MRQDPLGFYQLTREGPGGEDYPDQLTYPDHIIDPGAPLPFGGVRLETAAFGPGEHESATVFYEPRSGGLFAGDLVANRATPALLEGRSCGWLVDLDRLQRRFPEARTLYPGHGEPGDAAALIERQRTYLTRFRAPGPARPYCPTPRAVRS